MAIAERYIDAFSKLAKTNNTMLLPTETGDVSTMVAKVRPALGYPFVHLFIHWFTIRLASSKP